MSKFIEPDISDKEKIMNAAVKSYIKELSIAENLINVPASADKCIYFFEI